MKFKIQELTLVFLFKHLFQRDSYSFVFIIFYINGFKYE
jgi:hypothetical protein